MIMESEVGAKLAAFLGNEISLHAFEDWLVARSWDMHRDSDSSVQELVAAIELVLSEYSSGHLSPLELRNELTELANAIRPFPLFSLEWKGARISAPPALATSTKWEPRLPHLAALDASAKSAAISTADEWPRPWKKPALATQGFSLPVVVPAA